MLLEAIRTSNVVMLDKLLHNGLIFIIPTGQTITKADYLKNYQSGKMKVSEIQSSDRIVEFFDNTVVVTITINLKAKYDDQTIEGKFRYLRIYKLFGNLWKVIAGIGFSI